jgi:[protein-PII] uridylyltransferase
LHRGLQDPLERAEHIQLTQRTATNLLGDLMPAARSLWHSFGEEYFLRHTPEQLAHHTRLLMSRADNSNIVDIQPVTESGGTEIFISAPAETGLFSRIAAVLDQLALNVVDAGITTTTDNYILDTFHVLEESGMPVEGDLRSEEIRTALLDELNNKSRKSWQISRRKPRQYRHFPIKTHIEFKLDKLDQRTIMEIVTSDRPGLLSRIGRAFADCEIKLLNARIATLGSRAEDVYYITDRNDRPLTDELITECLEKAIHRYLDEEKASGDR